jgi:hypothetical protein
MIVLMFTVVLFLPTPFHLKYAFYTDCYNKSHNTSHLLWCICSIIFMVYMFHNFYGCSYMKAPNLILALLILGPTAPENEIDVDLRPLIDDLHEL